MLTKSNMLINIATVSTLIGAASYFDALVYKDKHLEEIEKVK